MNVRVRGILPLVALVVLFFALAPFGVQARTAVSGTRLGIHPDGVTRFVMDISEKMDFSVTVHSDPMRVSINTEGVAWMTDAALPKAVGAVARLRYEENRDGGRIQLLLRKPALVKSTFIIPPRDNQGWRFVMDLREASQSEFLAEASPADTARPPHPDAKADTAPPAPPVAPASPVSPAPPVEHWQPPATATTMAATALDQAPAQNRAPIVVTSPAATQPGPKAVATDNKPGGSVMVATVPPPLQRQVPPPHPAAPVVEAVNAPSPAPVALPEPVVTKVAAPLPAPQPAPAPTGDLRPVVVIDPGHGGADPGAIGVSGAYEKNITLAMARELKSQLEKTGRYRVHLTRDRDIFIRLRERIAIARDLGADLFISLHADAVKNPSIRGLSVYTLSQSSSDAEAEALAEKENKADLIAGIDLSHESMDVANILIDLAQRETMNRSAVFAGKVVNEVGRATTLLGNTHRFAGFAVLKAPDVPSVLVEMGYLSNKVEERQLRRSSFRHKLASALVRSVDGFFLHGQRAGRP